jgi:hypothetical protein
MKVRLGVFAGVAMHEMKAPVAAALLLIGGASVASASTITVGGGTTGTIGAYDLVSNPTNAYSYVNVDLSTPIAFPSIISLSGTFTDILGGAYGGSPRIELGATDGDFFLAYLGTLPSFIEGDPATFTSDFSGANLDNGTNNSAFENLGSYQLLTSLQTMYASDLIDSVSFIVDGGWAVDQDLKLAQLDLNGENLLVPEPSSLAMLLAGLGLIGGAMYFGRKKVFAS